MLSLSIVSLIALCVFVLLSCNVISSYAVVTAASSDVDSSNSSSSNTGSRKPVVLNDNNFESEVFDSKSIDLWIVDFYAPWCGHCKQLDPILKSVAKELSKKDTTADDSFRCKIGKVDATKNVNIANKYNITSYPTILYFKQNPSDGYHVSGKYDGKRTHDGIVSFINKLSLPTYVTVNSIEELSSHYNSHPVIFLLTIKKSSSSNGGTNDGKSDELVQLFEHVAMTYQSSSYFAIRYVDAVQAVDKDGKSLSYNFEKYEKDRKPIAMASTIDDSSIHAFVKYNNRELISLFDSHNFKNLGSLDKVMIVGIYGGSYTKQAMYTAIDTEISKLSLQDQDKFVFGVLDGVKWKRFLKQYIGAKVNTVMILNIVHDDYYIIKDTDSIHESIDKYINGKIMLEVAPTLYMYDRLLMKLQDSYPWSLLCFVPLLLLVVAVLFPNPNSKKKKE